MTTLRTAAACLALAGSVFAGGGFWLEMGTAPSGTGALASVRTVGCASPQKAEITATLEGVAKGVRQSVAATTTPLKEPGIHAIAGSVPAGGAWVLRVTAREGGRETGIVIPIRNGAVTRTGIKHFAHHPDDSDITAALRALAE
ncbi:MAG: hypothetical protein FJW40_10070 [Acidobacteria bacterium]|nr:hypothetical protein [Acidobacteriota bacterium]